MSTHQQASLPMSVFGHPNADTTLLWHPAAGSDAGRVAAIAKRLSPGRRIIVPVWSDGGDLLRSIRYARESAVHPPDELSVIGYADAGIAALGLALNQRRLGIGLREVVCVEGGPDLVDPISGQPLPAPSLPKAPTGITIVAGGDPASAEWSKATAAAWKVLGWAVDLTG